MNPSFAGKVAVVTGGAHGIGKAIAEVFREEGAAVTSDFEANKSAGQQS